MLRGFLCGVLVALVVPRLFFFRYLGKAVLRDCGISSMSSLIFEPAHDKTYKMACAPGEDSDQPGHSPSLIRVFALSMKKVWVFSYPLRDSKKSDWADAFSECLH